MISVESINKQRMIIQRYFLNLIIPVVNDVIPESNYEFFFYCVF